MIRHLLTAVLALSLTGCFSNKSDNSPAPNPGPDDPEQDDRRWPALRRQADLGA